MSADNQIAWTDLGGDIPDIMVAFADETAARRALMQDELQLRGGALQVRPRVWPLDSPAIRRIEPDRMVQPRYPESWHRADHINFMLKSSPGPRPQLNSWPNFVDLEYAPWSQECSAVPRPWVTPFTPLPAPPTPTLSAGPSSLATTSTGPQNHVPAAAMKPIVDQRDGHPFTADGTYQFQSKSQHAAAIQKIIDECELREGEELTPMPWPKLKFPPGFRSPEYKVPKIISDAQEIRRLKTEARKNHASPTQLAWGVGYSEEGVDYRDRPRTLFSGIPPPPPAFDENGNPPPGEPIHGPDSPYYTWIARREAPEPPTADGSPSASTHTGDVGANTESGHVPGPSGHQPEEDDEERMDVDKRGEPGSAPLEVSQVRR